MKPLRKVVRTLGRNLRGGTAALGAMGVGAGIVAFAGTNAVLRRIRAIDARGKVAIVTGGTRGLGLLIADELARLGAKVAVCGRDRDALAHAEQRLRAHRGEVLACEVDLAKREDAEAFVDEVAATFGGIDLVVNNAGIIQVGPLEQDTVERFEEAMRANFWSAAVVTLRALPWLRRSGAGRITNITSIGARIAVPHLLPYTASKFALIGLSEGLRAELAGSGVRVVTIVPGLMRTGSFYNAEFAGKQREELTWFSVLASAPLLSMNAKRAARRVVRATLRGDALVHLGLSGYLGALAHAIAPRLVIALNGVVARLLPASPGMTGLVKGRDLRARVQRSPVTALGNRAARENNEAPPR
jgi:NAD(P)-dependent dehydrogenase (short-subunit alcohol dehydrogenase family)